MRLCVLAGLAVAPCGILELGQEVLVVLLYIACVIVDGEPANLKRFAPFFYFFFWPVCLMVATVKELKGNLEKSPLDRLTFSTEDEQGTLNYLSPGFSLQLSHACWNRYLSPLKP